MDFWVNHKTFLISLSLCLSSSLLFDSIYLFIYLFLSILQIKDATASSHSTSVNIMCEDHDYISPQHKTFTEKRYILRYYKCAHMTILDCIDKNSRDEAP